MKNQLAIRGLGLHRKKKLGCVKEVGKDLSMTKFIPADNPNPSCSSGEVRVGESSHSEEEEELGQVLQGILVGPLNTVEHLQIME
jgi:hypothetical protein